MTFGALLNRTVTLVPRTPSGSTDTRGNEVLEDGTPVETRARRELVAGDEDTRDRERGLRTFLYFLPAGVTIDRLTKIIDGTEALEVLVVDPVDGRHGLHHYEVTARLIEG